MIIFLSKYHPWSTIVGCGLEYDIPHWSIPALIDAYLPNSTTHIHTFNWAILSRTELLYSYKIYFYDCFGLERWLITDKIRRVPDFCIYEHWIRVQIHAFLHYPPEIRAAATLPPWRRHSRPRHGHLCYKFTLTAYIGGETKFVERKNTSCNFS
jgi:hypothetical protein